MANKNVSIIDNGVAIEPRYTIRYSLPDECAPLGYQTKDLINLSPEELQTLTTSISKLTSTKSDNLVDFASEFAALCKKYNARGELYTSNNYTSWMNIGNHKITDMDFGSYGVTIGKRESLTSK